MKLENPQNTNKFLVDNPQFPYCKGCGHTWINKSLDLALQKLGKKTTQINLVSDIGCVGLVDKLFLTNTIHTTHGRSTAFACGLQLADEILFDDDTTHVVMIGDGGATIGLLHLVEAAKLNANVTVILHNNFVYGMTGGQNSGLTPENFKTSTTMSGNIVAPVHIADLLKAAHAGFIARKLATDRDLDEVILQALNYNGFALVEVIELCTGYATKWNSMSKRDVQKILESMDSGEMGTIIEYKDKKTYAQNYTRIFPKKTEKLSSKERQTQRPKIEVKQEIKLNKPFSVVMAGSAGEGVQFASRMFIESAIAGGLNAVQKNDNPITIGTGFSVTELNFSSEEIYYSGIQHPDYILIGSIDGFNRATSFVESAKKSTMILVDSTLESSFKNFLEPLQLFTIPDNIIYHPFRKKAKNPRVVNFMMIGYLFKYLTELNLDFLKETVVASGKKAEPIIKALDMGFSS